MTDMEGKMAGIDKIYGTKAQAIELEAWLHRHRPKLRRFLYGAEYFEYLEPEDERPISNFSCGADKWLARKCPLPFVLERLAVQYGRSKTANIAKSRLAA